MYVCYMLIFAFFMCYKIIWCKSPYFAYFQLFFLCFFFFFLSLEFSDFMTMTGMPTNFSYYTLVSLICTMRKWPILSSVVFSNLSRSQTYWIESVTYNSSLYVWGIFLKCLRNKCLLSNLVSLFIYSLNHSPDSHWECTMWLEI